MEISFWFFLVTELQIKVTFLPYLHTINHLHSWNHNKVIFFFKQLFLHIFVNFVKFKT